MTTPHQDEHGAYYRDLGEGLDAFRDHGLLYLLNEYFLHGQGFEVSVADGRVRLYGDGREGRQWPPELLEGVDGRRRAARQAMLDAQQYNNPAHWSGEHSPGFANRGAVPVSQVPGGGAR